jgi:hypothetical protein
VWHDVPVDSNRRTPAIKIPAGTAFPADVIDHTTKEYSLHDHYEEDDTVNVRIYYLLGLFLVLSRSASMTVVVSCLI